MSSFFVSVIGSAVSEILRWEHFYVKARKLRGGVNGLILNSKVGLTEHLGHLFRMGVPQGLLCAEEIMDPTSVDKR